MPYASGPKVRAELFARDFIVALGDETTALKVASSLVTMRLPYAFVLTGVRASLATAQGSGSLLTLDVKAGGTSVFSTKPTFNNASKTTVGATPAVFSTTSLASDAELTFDVTQTGDGTAKGLKVTLLGYIP
jgi:hypothetical protein